MPPEVPIPRPSAGPIAPVDPNIQAIENLYDLSLLGGAIRSNSWDLRTEIDLLTSIARTGCNRDKLAAQRQIRLLTREIMEVNGRIATASQEKTQQLEDGSQLTQRASTARLLSSLQRNNPHGQHSDPRTHQEFLPPAEGLPSAAGGGTPSTPVPPVSTDQGSPGISVP